MIDMIQYVGKKGQNAKFFFGTDRFEYVWEKMIDFNFGILGFTNHINWNPLRIINYFSCIVISIKILCHRRITVHEHFYLKNEYGLAGIHIDNPEDSVPEGYHGSFTRSCTSIDQLKEFKKKSKYVFLKNIFDCIEFKEEKSTFSLQQLEKAASDGLIDKRVYALGGMSLENIRIAKQLGFKDLIQHFEKLQKAVG